MRINRLSLRKKIALTALIASSLGAAVAEQAHAANATWNVNAAGNWATGTSWTPTTAPGATSGNTNADIATFGTIINAARIVTVDANRNIGGINFAGNSSAYTLNSGNLLLTSGGVIQTSGGGTGHTDTINTNIALQGDGGIATFTAGSTTATRLLVINSGITGVATGSNVTTLTINGANTGNNVLGGVIGNGSGGGTLAIVKSDAGYWRLSGANTFSGGVTLNAGTLSLGSATALGSAASLFTINGGSLEATAATTLTANNAQNWNGNFSLGGTFSLNLGTGAVTMNASRTVTLTGSGTYTVGGAIAGAGFSLTTANSATTNSITGKLQLNGANTYDGGTNIGGGVVAFGASAVPATGTITIQTNGALEASGAQTTVMGWLGDSRLNASSTGAIALAADSSENINMAGFNTLSLGATVGLTAAYTGTLTPAATTYYLGGGGGTINLTAANALSGANDLVAGNGGAGTVVLAAANNYSGTTTIKDGALQIRNAGALGTSITPILLTNAGTPTVTEINALELTGGINLSRNIVLENAGNGNSRVYLRSVNALNTTANTVSGTITAKGASAAQNILADTAPLIIAGSLLNDTLDPTPNISLRGASTGTIDTGAIINIGTAALVKTDPGTWTFNNTTQPIYSSLQISDGFIVVGVNNALSTTAPITIGQASTTVGRLTINAGVTQDFSTISTFNGSTATTPQLVNGPGSLNLGAVQKSFIINDTSSATDLNVGAVLIGTGGVDKTGAGTLQLSGANTYTGPTNITNGEILVSSINSVIGGTATSSLGAPTTLANGTINLGSTTTTGALTFNNAAGEITDRVLNMAGTTGGATLTQSSTAGLLKFTNDLTVTGVGAKTLTLAGSTAGTAEFAGLIGNGSGTVSLTKAGTGTWTISGTSAFTGATTSGGGLLVFAGPRTGAGGVTINAGTNSTVRFTNPNIAGTTVLLSGATGATTPIFQVWLNGGGTISTPFSLGGNSGLTMTVDVNNNGSGTNGVIQFNGNAGGIGTSTYNFTGGNGYSLFIKALSSSAGTAGSHTFNPTSTTVEIGTLTTTQGSGTNTFVLGGTSAGNGISGNLTTSAATLIVTKSGTSTWYLGGNNTYTGATNVSAGILNIRSNNALGTVAGGTIVAAGATLQLQGNITTPAEALTVNGLGVAGQNGAVVNVSGTNNYGGLLTLGSATTLASDAGTINFTNTGSITGAGFGLTLTGAGNGSISGSLDTTTGTVTKTGTGTWTLGGANTFTGVTTVNQGTLVYTKPAGFYGGVPAGYVASNYTVAAGAALGFNIGGAGEFAEADILTIASQGTASTGFVTGSFLALDTSNSAGSITFTSAIPNANGGANIIGVQKTGSKTLVLAGANTYGGGTTIVSGLLQFQSLGAIPAAGSITPQINGALVVDGAYTTLAGWLGDSHLSTSSTGALALIGTTSSENYTPGAFATLSLGVAAGNSLEYTGTYTPSGGTYYVGGGGGTLTLSNTNALTGANNVVVGNGGGGTLIITGDNDYTGSTIVKGTPLQIGNGGATGSLGSTTSLAIDGTLTINRTGTLTLPSISGTGNFVKNGTGTVVLTGVNTFAGSIALNAGKVVGSLPDESDPTLGTWAFANPPTNTLTSGTNAEWDLGSNSQNLNSLTVLSNNATTSKITVAPGKTLDIGTFTLGFNTGATAVAGTTAQSRLIIDGGGALNISNAASTFSVGVVQSVQLNTPTTNVLNVTALSSVQIGTVAAPITNIYVGFGQTNAGTLLLSNTANTLATTTLNIGHSNGANGGNGIVTLGTGTNLINADSITIGASKVNGTLSFASQVAASPGTVTIGNKAGTGGAAFVIGSQTGTSTAGTPVGTLDLRGHDATVVASTVQLGNTNGTSTGTATGILRFNQGTFTATSLDLGLKSSTGGGSNTGNILDVVGGTFTVSGAVRSSVHTATSGAANTTSNINVSGGTLSVGTMNVAPKNGAGTGVATGNINVSGGAFNVTGTTFTLGSQASAGTSVALLNITGGAVSSNADILKGAGATTATVNLSSGSLNLNGKNLGDATNPIDTLTFAAGTLSNVNQINGGAAVTKTTAGTLTYTGTNAYSGATTVSAGTLNVNGSLTNSVVTVNSGATLSGSGTITNAVNLDVGSTLSPGNSPGSINTGNMTWVAGANYNWQAANMTSSSPSGTNFDFQNVTGTLDVQAGFKFNLWSLSDTLPDTNAAATGFNAAADGYWKVASATTLTGAANLGSVMINVTPTNGTGGFSNPLLGGGFTLVTGDTTGLMGATVNDVYLKFTTAVTASAPDLAVGTVTTPDIFVLRNASITSATASVALSNGNSNTGSVNGFTTSAPLLLTATANQTISGSGAITPNSVISLLPGSTANNATAIGATVTYATSPTDTNTTNNTATVNVRIGSASFGGPDSSLSYGSKLVASTPVIPLTPVTYTDLSSTTTANAQIGSAVPALGTTATIFNYTNANGTDTGINMEWRSRTAVEASSNPLLGDNGSTAVGYLISDVVNITGMGNNGGLSGFTDTFVLQMNYKEALLDGHEIAGVNHGNIKIAWKNNLGQWVSAVEGNSTPGGTYYPNQAYNAAPRVLGDYGIVPGSDLVWAVLDHNSEFAVIPEPSTLVLGGLALLGFAGVGIRRRRLAKQQA